MSADGYSPQLSCFSVAFQLFVSLPYSLPDSLPYSLPDIPLAWRFAPTRIVKAGLVPAMRKCPSGGCNGWSRINAGKTAQQSLTPAPDPHGRELHPLNQQRGQSYRDLGSAQPKWHFSNQRRFRLYDWTSTRSSLVVHHFGGSVQDRCILHVGQHRRTAPV